jgi:hypothetical protein
MAAAQQFFLRLNVHQNLCNFLYLIPHPVGHGMRNLVPLAHR